MVFTTLDIIVRRVLLQKSMPIHYYIEYLTHAAACLRELNIDTLQLVNTESLTLDSAFSAPLPCDYMDLISVGIPIGQYTQSIPQKSNITALRNYNTVGQVIPYGAVAQDAGLPDFPFWGAWNYAWSFGWNMDDLGEALGRLYGAGSTNPNGFEVFKAQGRIQFTETFAGTQHPVLQYISNGQTITNATQVDYQAQNAIESFIVWKKSRNADNVDSPEGYSYKVARKGLRSRLNPMTCTDIRQIMYNSYIATYKN
jgi:hypothetical protein